jgi:hypothetical protein
MHQQEIKTDQFGWKYYESLPSGYRLATLDDFHVKGNKKVGMEYLIQRANKPHFEIHHIRLQTRSSTIQPFIDHEMVFVREQ